MGMAFINGMMGLVTKACDLLVKCMVLAWPVGRMGKSILDGTRTIKRREMEVIIGVMGRDMLVNGWKGSSMELALLSMLKEG